MHDRPRGGAIRGVSLGGADPSPKHPTLPHMHARQASWGRDWGRKQVVEVMAAAQVRDDEHKHRSLDLDIL